MKVRVIQVDGNLKRCIKCGNTIFRKSTRSRYTNKERTEGETYTLFICDKCGYREVYNKIKWRAKRK